MCEFCTKHGEGKKWYENIRNYTEEVFHQVNSMEKLKAFLNSLYHSLKFNPERAYKWKRRFPRVYNFIVYPLVTRHLMKTHFGQIVPMEDVENILDNVNSIVRLPCVCRKVTIGEGKRYCFGIGLDLTPVFKDTPDFREFERLSSEEAKAFIRGLDTEGKTHSIWTFSTPFIGALCNCDRDCIAYRVQLKLKICKAMWKSEYIAIIDLSMCNGCKECMKRCYFGSILYSRKDEKCSVEAMKCYGCGICRAVCKNNAIILLERKSIMSLANNW